MRRSRIIKQKHSQTGQEDIKSISPKTHVEGSLDYSSLASYSSSLPLSTCAPTVWLLTVAESLHGRRGEESSDVLPFDFWI